MKTFAKTTALAALLVLFAGFSFAADEPDWQPVVTDLLKNEKPGYGGLSGMAVDRKTGCVWIFLSDKGLYCSSAGAKEFKRTSDKAIKGRSETPGCVMLDPTGKSKAMLAALVYGAPVGVSPDHGTTWKFLDGKSGHVDWCAVDWTDPDMKFVLTLAHEKGGLLLRSNDGGKSFTEVGKNYGTGWIFDGKTAVVCEHKTGKDRPQAKLLRTTDGGETWKPCGEFCPVGINSAQAMPKWLDGALYWLVDGALISTTDKGETWKKVCELKDARYGPIFGKDAKHMFVLTGAGIIESKDGGATWEKPIAPPKDLKGIGGLTWLEYDPTTDSLYLMKMTSDLYKLTRGKS